MHDIVKSYQKPGGPSACAIKVDIMKAFDTVKWDYPKCVLAHMNFPSRFRHWIFLCLSTTSFSINLNGSLIGNFTATRGLRQGDPLSPALFILVMEGFTQFLKVNSQLHPFHYHTRCAPQKINSLAFADDLFILSKADEASIRTIKDTLNSFSAMSCLNPNLTKCEIFFSGTTASKKHFLASILGIADWLPPHQISWPSSSKQKPFLRRLFSTSGKNKIKNHQLDFL